MTAGADVTALLDELVGREHDLTTDIIARIRTEVAGYACFPYEEHHHDVLVGMLGILDGLRTRQPPAAEAIEHARTMGRRRAQVPIALADSIEAYHIAYREIWAELIRRARAKEPDCTSQLVGAVALLWNWVHRLSAAFADAHVEESRDRAATRLALRRRFVEALSQLHTPAEVRLDLARSLAFDADGVFLVACTTSRGEAGIEQTNNALAAMPGVGHCVAGDPGIAVLVTQDIDTAGLIAAARAGEPEALIGIGLPRRGLPGAALGLADAQDALRRSTAERPVVDFAGDWLTVLLDGARDRLVPLLAAGAEIALANPQLAETVQAFAASRYSLSGCARALHIHPNSAKYRLDRWRSLTGWDVYEFEGLASSLTCLRLYPGRPERPVEPEGAE